MILALSVDPRRAVEDGINPALLQLHTYNPALVVLHTVCVVKYNYCVIMPYGLMENFYFNILLIYSWQTCLEL